MTACAKTGIVPLIAMGREAHHPSLDERFAKAPLVLENPSPLETVAYHLQTPGGKEHYALRKQVPGTGVRHQQVGAGLPPVSAARDRPCRRRVEPCDHGLKYEADVHPSPRLTWGEQRFSPHQGGGTCRRSYSEIRGLARPRHEALLDPARD